MLAAEPDRRLPVPESAQEAESGVKQALQVLVRQFLAGRARLPVAGQRRVDRRTFEHRLQKPRFAEHFPEIPVARIQRHGLRIRPARVGDASGLVQQLCQVGPEGRPSPAPLDAGDEAVDRLRVLLLAFPQEPEALPSQGRARIQFQATGGRRPRRPPPFPVWTGSGPGEARCRAAGRIAPANAPGRRPLPAGRSSDPAPRRNWSTPPVRPGPTPSPPATARAPRPAGFPGPTGCPGGSGLAPFRGRSVEVTC